ncbi:MAG: hypothetical protein GXP32_03640 [Kiritimatiellaeota bacterium]|nr:hypothetical protein [Kiritimatiellota bacterium]
MEPLILNPKLTRGEASSIINRQSFILGYAPHHLALNSFIQISSSAIAAAIVVALPYSWFSDSSQIDDWTGTLFISAISFVLFTALFVWARRVRHYWKDKIIITAEGIRRTNPESEDIFFSWNEIESHEMNLVKDELHIRSNMREEMMIIDIALSHYDLAQALILAMAE